MSERTGTAVAPANNAKNGGMSADHPDVEMLPLKFAPSTSGSGGNGLSIGINGGVTATHPPAERFPILVAPSFPGRGKNTIRMELIPLACWRLNGVRFAFASSFVLPEARKEFLELLRLRKAHPGAPLSVFGHADTVGDDAFNKKLSGHRADSIYAVLTRDTSRWEKLYSSGGQSEGWGVGSVQQMLAALGYDVGPTTGNINPQTRKALEQFQSRSDLIGDGRAGPETRAKLFAAYMDFLCQDRISKTEFLAQGADAEGKGDVQGCGEFNPVMIFSEAELSKLSGQANKGTRDSENGVNRRVVILLFRPGTSVPPGKWPCPRTSEGVDGCRKRFWSDADWRRASQSERREFGRTKDTFACRFYDRLVGASPCEGVLQNLFRVVLLKGCVRNAVGHAALVLEAVDGSYRLEQPLSDGREESGHLIFDFYVRERCKRYKCYLKGHDKPKHLNVLPRRMVRPVEKVEET